MPVRIPSVDENGALTGASRRWVEGLLTKGVQVRGVIPSATNVDTMRGPNWAGEWDMPLAPAVNTLTGTAPPVGWLPGQFKVMGWAGGTTNLASQLYMPYTTGKGMWYRTIHAHTQTGATAWSPWVNLADVTDTLIGATPNALLIQDFTRRRGPVNTNGKGAVALRFDHGLANFRDKILPLLRARGLKASLALNSRSWGLAENGGVTAAEVDGWVAEGVVEIWNHGAHHSDAVTRAELEDTIVTGLAELRTQLPSAQIDGWVVPGVGGTNYNGFNGGGNTGVFTSTEAGRLILAHHAVATGAIPGTAHRVLDGTVRQGMSHYTLDAVTGTAAQYQINLAATNVTGLQLLLHPSAVDQPDKVTTAKLTEILDHIVTKRDAGELVVLSPYQLMLAETSTYPTTSPMGEKDIVSARDYGVKGDNYVSDDTEALQAAADAARASGKRLVVHGGLKVRITQPVNMRYIDVQFDGMLRVDQTTGYGVLVGDKSTARAGREISFRSVLHKDATAQAGVPCVRVQGLMAGVVTMGRCDYLQLFASTNTEPTTGDALAYSTFLFNGGSIRHLELLADGPQSWVNENKFFGGDFRRITLRGDYTLNNNIWFGPSLEGASTLIDIQVGARNKFLYARSEYGPTVKFGASTWHNLLLDSWNSSPQNRSSAFVVAEDLGTENIVSGFTDQYLRPYTLASVNAQTAGFDTATPFTGAPLRPGLLKPAVNTSFQAVMDTGILPTRLAGASLERLEFASDAALWRPKVYFYDASMVPLPVTGRGFIDTDGGWTVSTDGLFYQFSSGQAARNILLKPGAPAYMRVELGASGSTAGKVFEHLTLTGWVKSPRKPTLVGVWREALRKPLTGTRPSQGWGKVGTTVREGAVVHTVTQAGATYLSATSVSGATDITIAAAIPVGAVVGVLLSTGFTHWTTTTTAGGAVTLTAALPADAVAGAPVVWNVWS